MKAMISIDPQFTGPPDCANGGYLCGRLAQFLDGPAEITLRRPTPVGQVLELSRNPKGHVHLYHDDQLLAEGRTVQLDVAVPEAPAYLDALLAANGFRGFHEHLFPECFVCGTHRDHGHGLRIFSGPLAGQDILAAPWVPHQSFADAKGYVKPEFLWAALDCPGFFAAQHESGLKAALLGRMSAQVVDRVKSGERCIVTSWSVERHGRKHVVGTALYNEAGKLCTVARATWVAIEADMFAQAA